MQTVYLSSLTCREKDIACDVAEGLSNRQIAIKRGVAVKTVAHGIYMLAQKIDIPEGFSSRVYIARFIWEALKNA